MFTVLSRMIVLCLLRLLFLMCFLLFFLRVFFHVFGYDLKLLDVFVKSLERV